MPTLQDSSAESNSKRQLAMSWPYEDIISAYRRQPAIKPNGFSVTDFVYPAQESVAYIKFGRAERNAEIRNQESAFQALSSMPSEQTKGVRIPEVSRFLEEDGTFIIFMEYNPGKTLV
ncbi:hypothetical protein Daus18300_010884 [Diaporthe australafricana]|uniref:Aminoglycoside phosphotransferase domain-containing protein n=1 Tax=Diaporthe australafricana TaxID=127596 RepID=A0ABR3W8Q0_9PEZI